MPGREIGKVLVANRGEIALRVIRACRALGVAAVAVYSDPDRAAPHVRAADEAYRIGPGPAAESYLSIPSVIDAARRSRADAVHPGYGFLAENAAFAAACADEGIRFVGPPAAVLARCGDKAETRRAVREAGVPVLPGTGSLDDAAAAAEADRLGYPLLIKAAAGGGGKGIHRVARPEELDGALRLARGEARASFGDDRVYLERWIDDPRHIEVQIAADAFGEIVQLGERDCSVQRRHQKVIEEAPSPALESRTRDAMARAAVAAARAVDYRNAGTVEFLVDGDAFYFLEINARLQVEHPVTEFVAGVDLVAWQLAIASEAPLPRRQHEIVAQGHAIECRISAEDPSRAFMPWAGRIGSVVLPGGPGIRIDGALVPGLEVTRFYDPLLAKVIAWAPTRSEAIARMSAALSEMIVTGVPTTMPFHRWALTHPAFSSGRYTTRFVDVEWPRRAPPDPDLAAVAAAVLAHSDDRRAPRLVPQADDAWRAAARREGLS